MEQVARWRGVQNFPVQRVILNRAFHQRRQVGELGQFRERAAPFNATCLFVKVHRFLFVLF